MWALVLTHKGRKSRHGLSWCDTSSPAYRYQQLLPAACLPAAATSAPNYWFVNRADGSAPNYWFCTSLTWHFFSSKSHLIYNWFAKKTCTVVYVHVQGGRACIPENRILLPAGNANWSSNIYYLHWRSKWEYSQLQQKHDACVHSHAHQLRSFMAGSCPMHAWNWR